jgi:hypothetical protein
MKKSSSFNDICLYTLIDEIEVCDEDIWCFESEHAAYYAIDVEIVENERFTIVSFRSSSSDKNESELSAAESLCANTAMDWIRLKKINKKTNRNRSNKAARIVYFRSRLAYLTIYYHATWARMKHRDSRNDESISKDSTRLALRMSKKSTWERKLNQNFKYFFIASEIFFIVIASSEMLSRLWKYNYWSVFDIKNNVLTNCKTSFNTKDLNIRARGWQKKVNVQKSFKNKYFF